MELRPRVLALVGPTGSGKTELACELAGRCDAEVISADSMQVYRGMDIGTAKPSVEQRARVPHHAIDVVDPDDPMSAGRYAAIARAAAQDVLARGKRAILCGGSGLYARAFVGGLIDGPEADPRLRSELEALASEELYAKLEAADPEAASGIHPNDRIRAVRALEVLELKRSPISSAHAEHGFADQPFQVLWLAVEIDREPLRARLARRVDEMFEAGLVEEVECLQSAGYERELKSMQSIGYREIGQLLAGEIDRPQAREAITTATRRYAKRQRTWFRAEPGLVWLAPDALLERALEFLDGASSR